MSFFSTTCLPPNKMHTSKGFTIVELLIVIVVIAILAAITIVAYNGVTNRAKQSAAQSLASQTTRKILAYSAINNGDYPDTLGDAGITDTKGLDYTADNTATPKKFGLTASSGNVSYYTTNESTSPIAGGYPGHGQNGVAAIRNQVSKPRGEAVTPWSSYGTAGIPNIGTSTVTGLPSGVTTAFSYTTTASSAGGPVLNLRNVYVAKGETMASMYVRSPSAIAIRLNVEQYNTTVAGVRGATITGTTVTLAPDTWTRLSTLVPFNAGNPYYVLTAYTPSSVPTGTTILASAAMLTEGPTLYSYADGGSTNWAWTGAVNASQSTGPATP
jgi:prepilin-type N-terminal cleavage/methylation domain-containing protein